MGNNTVLTAKPRRDYIDALKGLGIILVVLGHWGDFYRYHDGLFNASYECLYLFHMALFCVCSGMVARFRVRKWLTQQVWLYLVTQAVWVWYRVTIEQQTILQDGTPLWQTFLIPWRHAWYLYALLFWELTVPLLALARDKGKWPGKLLAMALAVGIGWAGGLQALPFELMRVTGFFPYFAFGVLFRDDLDALYRLVRGRWWPRLAAGAALLAVYGNWFTGIADAYVSPEEWEGVYTPFYFSAPYGVDGYTARTRMTIYLIALLTTVGLLVVLGGCPPLASLGQRTLPVYILHLPWLAFVAEQMHVYEYLIGIDRWWQMAWVLFNVGASVCLFSSWPFVKLFDLIANIWYKYLPALIKRGYGFLKARLS